MSHDQIARIAKIVWLVGIVVLVAPLAGLWAIKLFAALAGCSPGPKACSAAPLGAWFKTMLGSAIGLSEAGTVPLALVLGAAGIAAGSVWRTVAGIAAPLVVLLLAIIGAMSTTFPGCMVSEGGAGGCTLWGTDLNAEFSEVGVAPWLLIIGVPVAAIVATLGAIVAGVIRRRYEAAPVKAA